MSDVSSPADATSSSLSPSSCDRPEATRRDFIKSTSALVAGGTIFGTSASLARSANVNGSSEIKVALIGCGGRGEGAVTQALATLGPVTFWAAADAFGDNLKRCVANATKFVARGVADKNELLMESKVDVPEERQFVGFNAYQEAINSGADLILLATPPGFRPIHFEYAVEAGKHIFAEKPVAVDAPGVRRFLAANDKAKAKNLMVAIGLQRHHDPRYVETVERLHDGAIGDILFSRVYWNGGPLWIRNRVAGQTEMEYQMRNWYYFNWLCGDHIVEQHIHNLDVGNWVHGGHPSSANGMGGRQVRTGKDTGQIFDHHFVEFTYPNGQKMFSQCRHMEGCWTSVTEFAHGTRGSSHVGGFTIDGIEGKWRTSGKGVDAHHQEHHDMFAALRRGEIYNEGQYGGESTLTSIMGRMATYSGIELTWDEVYNSSLDLSPKSYDFAADPPVLPKADGYYPIPVPGKTNVLSAT